MTTKGCPQGLICGQIFWDIAIDKPLKNIAENSDINSSVVYTDGLVVVIEGRLTRELEH